MSDKPIYYPTVGDYVCIDNLPPKYNTYTEPYVVFEDNDLYGVQSMPRIIPEKKQVVFARHTSPDSNLPHCVYHILYVSNGLFGVPTYE